MSTPGRRCTAAPARRRLVFVLGEPGARCPAATRTPPAPNAAGRAVARHEGQQRFQNLASHRIRRRLAERGLGIGPSHRWTPPRGRRRRPVNRAPPGTPPSEAARDDPMRRDRPRFFLSRRPEIRDPGATARARAAGGPRGCPAAGGGAPAGSARESARRRRRRAGGGAARRRVDPASPEHARRREHLRRRRRVRHVALVMSLSKGSVVSVVFVVSKSLPERASPRGGCFSAAAARPNVTRRIRAAWSVSVVASFSRSVEDAARASHRPSHRPSRRAASRPAARPSSSSAKRAYCSARPRASARRAPARRCASEVPLAQRAPRSSARRAPELRLPRRDAAGRVPRRLRNSGERGLERGGIIRRRRTFRSVARLVSRVREPSKRLESSCLRRLQRPPPRLPSRGTPSRITRGLSRRGLSRHCQVDRPLRSEARAPNTESARLAVTGPRGLPANVAENTSARRAVSHSSSIGEGFVGWRRVERGTRVRGCDSGSVVRFRVTREEVTYVPSAAATRRRASQSPAPRSERGSDEKAGFSVAGADRVARGSPSVGTDVARDAVDRCGHHLRPGEISRRGTRFRHPRLVIVCSRVRVCPPPLRDRAPTVTGRVGITGAAPRATLVPADDARA